MISLKFASQLNSDVRFIGIQTDDGPEVSCRAGETPGAVGSVDHAG